MKKLLLISFLALFACTATTTQDQKFILNINEITELKINNEIYTIKYYGKLDGYFWLKINNEIYTTEKFILFKKAKIEINGSKESVQLKIHTIDELYM